MDLKNNIQRIENMLYSICGCNSKDAKKVLEECLKRNSCREEYKFVPEDIIRRMHDQIKNSNKQFTRLNETP